MVWKIGKVIHLPAGHVEHIAYHKDGAVLVATGGNKLYLVDALGGSVQKTINSETNGCRLATPSHHPNCVFYASGLGRQDEYVDLLSFHDNCVLKRYAVKGAVTNISICMKNDSFLVSTTEGVFLFDDQGSKSDKKPGIIEETTGVLKHKNCLGCFDPEGLVFAVALVNRKQLLLYDVANYKQGPFASFDYNNDSVSAKWGQIKFSPDGKLIFINDHSGKLLIIDSFEGDCKQVIEYGQPAHKFAADWTVDSRCLMIGSDDDKINVYAVADGRLVDRLEGHTLYPTCVAVNPVYNSFSSACSNIALWLQD